MPGKCIFNKLWLDYKDWIATDEDPHKANFRICLKKLDLSSMGELALKSHMNPQRDFEAYAERKKKKKDKIRLAKLVNKKEGVDL
ncbi:hypothetical protein AVEN_53716-1 [Araneus ventricosus]|uniref:Uncharacterized protein n=1 Tax=Araneus ventricosus TaxID=182803 RepID=A0A4Y2EJ78_ARAVE|nr:hypothetical protein AVEN_53716-1 [Araneus ventricosus]